MSFMTQQMNNKYCFLNVHRRACAGSSHVRDVAGAAARVALFTVVIVSTAVAVWAGLLDAKSGSDYIYSPIRTVYWILTILFSELSIESWNIPFVASATVEGHAVSLDV